VRARFLIRRPAEKTQVALLASERPQTYRSQKYRFQHPLLSGSVDAAAMAVRTVYRHENTPHWTRAKVENHRTERSDSLGKDNRSDNESRAASWRGMPRRKASYWRELAIFPRRGYIPASAAATPKTRPRNSARRAALRSLPAFRRSPVVLRRSVIESTASKPAGIGGTSLRTHHKTGSRLRIFQP
jgi:hypothetical protein